MIIKSLKVLIIFQLFFAISLFANIGKIVSLKGDAYVIKNNKEIKLKKNSIIFQADKIITKSKSRLQILFKDNTIISIGQKSEFKVEEYFFDNKEDKYSARFKMTKGIFRTITGKIGKFAPEKFKLKTKSASIGIRGTQIILNLTENKEDIFCTEGKIFVEKDSSISLGKIINSGRFVSISKSDISSKLIVQDIKPSDLKKFNKELLIENNLPIDKINEKKQFDMKNLKNEFQKSNIEAEENLEESSSESSESTEENSEQSSSESNESTSEPETISEPEPEPQTIPVSTAEPIVVNLFKLTPSSVISNLNSKVTYIGDFNNKDFSVSKQYLDDNGNKVEIPESTKISMDIDFEKTSNHITNGEITFLEYDNMNFVGEIKDADEGELELNGTGVTTGSSSAYLYGDNANTIRGNVNFENNSNLEIKADFFANHEDYINEDYITLDDITPETYFDNTNSTATYIGDFNNYAYDNSNQYFKDINGDKQAIPTNTSISMDIDFGATSNHISNGQIIVSDIGNSTPESLQFIGEIKDASKGEFELEKVSGLTDGGGGEGFFYGDEANVIQGDIDLKSKATDIQVKGEFEASKQ